MGASGGASTGGGGGGVGPAGMTGTTVVAGKTKRNYGTTKDAKKTAKRNEFRNSGAKKIDNQKIGVASILKPVFKAGSRSTRDYFTNKVLASKGGKKKFGNKQQFESLDIEQQNKIYAGYIGDRQSGKTDAMGNPTPKLRGGNNNTPTVKVASIPKVTTAPTEAEVSQSAATDATTVKVDDIYTRKKKSKARGRSMMTLTSAQGIKKDDDLVLGKRSLLGS